MADSPGLTRRQLLGAATAGSLGLLGASLAWPVLRQPQARVVVLRQSDYDRQLSERLEEGLLTFPQVVARIRGGRVVLKPNFVEFHEGRPINTDPRFVAAAVEAFRRAGAKEVLVGEGPGHLRDTEYLLEGTGMGRLLREVKAPFVDLNVDRARRVTLPRDTTGFGHLDLAATALGADLLVSVAKMKTHHWAGVTLTMKNLFGLVPSAIYGWPKNPLHWKGIEQSVFDLWDAVRPGFGLVDGVVAMEGDGPIMGTAKPMGVVVMGENLPAVDATTTRLMGLDPQKIPYLQAAAKAGGTIHAGRILVDGDAVAASPFQVLPKFEALRLG